MGSLWEENGEAGIYVVDRDYRVVYFNKQAKAYFPELEIGRSCSQNGNQTTSQGRHYNAASGQWLEISCGRVSWPGHEECRLILSRLVDEKKEVSREREKMDSLTGLLRYGPFLEEAKQLLEREPDKRYYMAALDIEHFKLFNEWYGEEEGNRFLIKIGEYLKEAERECKTAAGYMGGDDFAIILPEDSYVLEKLEEEINADVRRYGRSAGFFPVFGIYPIEDREISVGMMYDRALIALNTVKGNYACRMGWYDAGMKRKMESDQVLLSEIQRALENREFVFYAQPQCNMLSGKIIGLESLVRWKHPQKGLIPPGEFIPLLEKSGFITCLDRYIWDMVCSYLHSWIAEGKRLVPVSVNVSRMDIYALDVAAEFKGLVKRYGIPPRLLEIEITESAYAEDYQRIRRVVEELREAGFPVFMDDFGSGYSSLNMLKDVNVDVIKIDTKFLDMDERSRSRGMGILETVVRMAKIMQMKVIAEGVEEISQVEFLRNIGCIYGQGYYYYRPMPPEEFERLLTNGSNMDYRGIQARQMTQLKLEDLFNEDFTSKTMLNNMLGGVALYDVFEDRCEILKVNEEYYRITGDNPVDMEERRRFVLNQVYWEDMDWLLNIFENAYDNPVQGAEGTFRRYRLNGELMWMHLKVFFLKEQDGHRLYYGTVSDTTQQIEKRQKLEASQRLLERILNLAGGKVPFKNIIQENQWAVGEIIAQMAPGGLFGMYCEKGFPLYFANDEFLSLLGYDSYEAFFKDIDGLFYKIIHPEDFKIMEENASGEYVPGMEYSFRCRMRKRDGSWLWAINKGRVVQAEDGRLAIVSNCLDITDTILVQKHLEEANDFLKRRNDELEFLSFGTPGGYYQCQKGDPMRLIYASDRFLELLGYTREELERLFKGQLKNMIHPEDYHRLKEKAAGLKENQDLTGEEFRILSKKGYIWVFCHMKQTGSLLCGAILNAGEIDVFRRRVEESRRLLSGIKQMGKEECVK